MPNLARKGQEKTTMNYHSKEVLAELGINTQDAGTHDFTALQAGGKKCFGQLLEDATVGLDHLEAAAMTAPMVEAIPANGALPDGRGDLRFNDGARFMAVDGHVKGLFSGRFEPYQHGDALDDIHGALDELGITKTAQNIRFDNDGARLSAHIFMPNMAGDYDLLTDSGEDILLGVRVRNGHDGSNALGLTLTGIRTVCLNYNLWGDEKYDVAISHSNGNMVRKWKEAIQRVQGSLSELPEVIEYAKSIEIATKDIAPIMLGAGLPKPYIVGGKRGHTKELPPLGVHPWAYNPAISMNSDSVSLWEAYNAGTAMLSHAYAGAPSQVERFSKLLGGVLKEGAVESFRGRGLEALAGDEPEDPSGLGALFG